MLLINLYDFLKSFIDYTIYEYAGITDVFKFKCYGRVLSCNQQLPYSLLLVWYNEFWPERLNVLLGLNDIYKNRRIKNNINQYIIIYVNKFIFI